MRQLLYLVFFVGVGYLIYTQGLPKYRAYKQAREQADHEAQQSIICVQQAEEANDTFLSELQQAAQPPVDRQLWSSAFIRMSGQLSAADTACSCPTTACASAGAALLELRNLVNEFDGMARAVGPGVTDAVGRQQRITELLASARASP